MSTGRRAIKLILTFLAGSALSRMLVFALLPLYTRILSPEDYGYYDLSITYVTIVASILFLDVWVATMRFMYRETSRGGKDSAVRSGFTLILISSGLLCVTGLLSSLWLDIPYLFLIIGYGLTTNAKELYGFVARGYDKNIAYSVSGAVNTAVMVVLNVLMLAVLHFDFSAIYIAAIIGNLVQCVWLEVSTRAISQARRQPFDRVRTKDMLRYALPLGVNSVSYWLLTGFGKFVVQDQMTLADNGYFGVGAKIGSLIIVITAVFTMAWQDISFARGNDDTNKLYRRATSFYFVFLGFGVAALLPILAIFFPLVVGASYSPVYDMVPSFVIVAVLGAFSTFLGNVFYALNKTAIVLYTTIASAIISIALSFPLVSLWGIIGANVAMCIAFTANIILRSIILSKLLSFGYRLQDVVSGLGIAGISVVVYYYSISALSLVFAVVATALFMFLQRRELRSLFQR